MTDKDALITQLQEEIRQLRETVRLLQEEVARLKKNSGNSSKPPLSDIVKPQKPARGRRKKRKRGAQPGHRKHTRMAFMKGGCHMSYSTIGQFFKEVKGLDLSRGVLCKATQKVSQALSASYQQLLEQRNIFAFSVTRASNPRTTVPSERFATRSSIAV